MIKSIKVNSKHTKDQGWGSEYCLESEFLKINCIANSSLNYAIQPEAYVQNSILCVNILCVNILCVNLFKKALPIH